MRGRREGERERAGEREEGGSKGRGRSKGEGAVGWNLLFRTRTLKDTIMNRTHFAVSTMNL